MNNQEIIKKYGINKNTGIGMMIQVILVMIALIFTMIGIYEANHAHNNITIVYISQAIEFLSIIIFGVVKFKNKNIRDFKIIINAYAVFLALQAAVLNMSDYSNVIAVLMRFIIIILACNCVLFSERLEKKDSVYISYAFVFLEIALYVIFLIGAPNSANDNLLRGLIFSGTIMAGSICLFGKARLEQLKNKS